MTPGATDAYAVFLLMAIYSLGLACVVGLRGRRK